jgi:hypothetical protein
MRAGMLRERLGMALAAGVLVLGAAQVASRGDEPGRFGRLFRFGGRPAAASPAESVEPEAPPASPAAAPPIRESGTGPRLVPRPRVSRPVTEADPIVTRISVGHSDDGRQFGMVLQVFADGTVIDTEGFHRVGAEAMRPLVQALQSADLHRPRSHCGGPATDSAELVHVVVFDRSFGRLKANAFSYSGNTEGCDPALRQLQAALEALQARLSGPPPSASPAPSPAPAPATPIAAPPALSAPRPITLTSP